MWFIALAALLAGLLGMDDILARLAAVEGQSMVSRQRIEELDASTLQLRRAQEAAQNAALLARLDPGPLTQLTPYGGASPYVPDLGRPLLERLRSDSAMVGLAPGRTDPTSNFGNVLSDPTFVTAPVYAYTLTTTDTLISDAVGQAPFWKAFYVLNSGTAPATEKSLQRSADRWTNAVGGTSVVGSSGMLDLVLRWGAAAGDITVYLSAADYAWVDYQIPSWLTAGIDVTLAATTPITNATSVTAYVEITDGTGPAATVLAQSDPEDIMGLNTASLRSRIETALSGVAAGTHYFWRLRLDVVYPASAGSLYLSLTQPQLSWSEDGSLPQFTPAVGRWIPEVTRFHGVRMYRTATQSINNNTQTTLLFPSGSATESTDTDGMHDTSSATGDIVIPWDGYWLFTGSVAFAANATGLRDMWFEEGLDGVARGGQRQINLVATQVRMSTLYLAYATTGAIWNLRVLQDSGGALNVLGSDRLTFFGVAFMGV